MKHSSKKGRPGKISRFHRKKRRPPSVKRRAASWEVRGKRVDKKNQLFICLFSSTAGSNSGQG